DRTIVPVDFGNTLRDADRKNPLANGIGSDILRISEPVERLKSGPSEAALKEIRDGYKLRRQAQKRVRWLAGAALAFGVVAAVAVTAGVVAEKRRKTALSRALASQAVLEADRQLDRAMLLAAQANAVQSTPESASSLLRVLHAAPVVKFLYPT